MHLLSDNYLLNSIAQRFYNHFYIFIRIRLVLRILFTIYTGFTLISSESIIHDCTIFFKLSQKQ